jgi:hypothetical protein
MRNTADVTGLINYILSFINIKLDIYFPGLQRDPKLLSELEREFKRVVPPALQSDNEEVVKNITEAIRAFYFQQRPVDMRNVDSLIDVSTQ